MPAGLQIFDASGAERLSLTDRLTRVVGTIPASSVSGSIDVPAFSLGTPFWFLLEQTEIFGPEVTISGTTLSWVKNASTIMYGVY